MIYTDKKSVVKAIPKYIKKLQEDIDYLDRIDDRLNTYISNVLSTPDEHNKFEILGCFRFLDFTDKYEFNVSKFKKFVKFYELLQFPSENGQMSFKLTPVQVFQFASILGFRKDNGRRLCRDALLYVPRKYSKTTSVAALAIWDLLFGPADAQAYVASNSFNQANICFRIISNTLKPLDPKMQVFRRNRDQIYSKVPGKTSFIQCLSSSPDRLDGLNASTIICDEYAAAPDAALKNVLTSSQGVRKEPLIVTITTGSTNLEGPFATIDLPNYKKILMGEIEDDSVFASVFEMDEGDEMGDPKVWHKVHPHLGVTVTEEFYETAWKKAQRSADDLVEFRTKLLNMMIPDTKVDWISPKVIERNSEHIKIEDFTTTPLCMVSIDLSVRDDMSCVCYGLYDSITKTFAFYCDYYLPKETVLTHTNSELYSRWASEGHLHICGDETINYEKIAQDIIDKSKYVRIIGINYDAYKNRPLVNHLKAQGVKCLQTYKQTYANFTSPIEAFQSGIYEGKMKIDDNPINQWCIMNCVIDEDSMGNRKMIKYTHNRKIEGAVCIAMSIGAFMNYRR
jgi:phage terminase large subunit-like protein